MRLRLPPAPKGPLAPPLHSEQVFEKLKSGKMFYKVFNKFLKKKLVKSILNDEIPALPKGPLAPPLHLEQV